MGLVVTLPNHIPVSRSELFLQRLGLHDNPLKRWSQESPHIEQPCQEINSQTILEVLFASEHIFIYGNAPFIQNWNKVKRLLRCS